MNANRQSDEFVVLATSANNGAAEAPAEPAEERDSAERNTEQAALSRTPSRTKCKTRGLHGVREAARKDGTLFWVSPTSVPGRGSRAGLRSIVIRRRSACVRPCRRSKLSCGNECTNPWAKRPDGCDTLCKDG